MGTNRYDDEVRFAGDTSCGEPTQMYYFWISGLFSEVQIRVCRESYWVGLRELSRYSSFFFMPVNKNATTIRFPISPAASVRAMMV